MDDKRDMLRHFLAALAYRTQKALRGAPPSFADYEAGNKVRTPRDIVTHMDSVLGYALTYFRGGHYSNSSLDSFAADVERLHAKLAALAEHLERGDPFLDTTPERMLQGPFADAMTHAGQLAMLRRLSGSPIPPENFIVADVSVDNLSPNQPEPVSPDAEWPEAPD